MRRDPRTFNCRERSARLPKTKSASEQPQPVRIGDSRERMIAVATRLFLSGGYHGIGIAEICSSAEVNKGTFYHFFPSKTELLLEIIDRRVAEVETLIQGIGATEQAASRKILNLFTMFQGQSKPGPQANQIVPGHLLGNVILELASSSPGVREAARARARPSGPATARCRLPPHRNRRDRGAAAPIRAVSCDRPSG